MLRLTEKGLYCSLGDFYVDPCRPVETAVVTHAHSDHARRGSRRYYCNDRGTRVLRARLGQSIDARGIRYGEKFRLGSTWVSFHSAGHILGSAQVRIESESGEVWVSSGDYKREPDPSCDPFETVECDTFVTEATFGTPSFAWPKSRDLGSEIADWWDANAAEGKNSVVFAYSLGKAQRVLAELKARAPRPVLTHETVTKISECYVEEGVELAPFRCASTLDTEALRGELLVIPPSSFDTSLEKRFYPSATAFASGWMNSGGGSWARRDRFDKGFVMSDHADWNDLVRTIQESKARQVFVQHRGTGALVRHLRSLGVDAHPEEALKAPLVPRPPLKQMSLGL